MKEIPSGSTSPENMEMMIFDSNALLAKFESVEVTGVDRLFVQALASRGGRSMTVDKITQAIRELLEVRMQVAEDAIVLKAKLPQIVRTFCGESDDSGIVKGIVEDLQMAFSRK